MGVYTAHAASHFLNNLEDCKVSLMICQHLLPHCALRFYGTWQWCGGQSSRPHPRSVLVPLPVVVLRRFYCFLSEFSSPENSGGLQMVVYKEAESTGSISSWSQQGQSCTSSTSSMSMQTLSSSICGLNRKISRKALKVITLDKKGICSGSRAADSSTFSYFLGSSVTGVQWSF